MPPRLIAAFSSQIVWADLAGSTRQHKEMIERAYTYIDAQDAQKCDGQRFWQVTAAGKSDIQVPRALTTYEYARGVCHTYETMMTATIRYFRYHTKWNFYKYLSAMTPVCSTKYEHSSLSECLDL